MSEKADKRRLTVHEAVGKRIRELTVDGGNDPDSNSFGVSIFFDDDTQVFSTCQLG